MIQMLGQVTNLIMPKFIARKPKIKHAYLCRACFENSCKNMGVELPKLDYMED